MKNKAGFLVILILFALNLVLAAGCQFLFHACGMTESGSYMACHWAQLAVVTLAVVAAIQSLIALVIPSPIFRRGLLLGEIPVLLAAMATPGYIINLCSMNTMRCQYLMRPVVLVVGGLCVVAAVVAFALTFKKGSEQ